MRVMLAPSPEQVAETMPLARNVGPCLRHVPRNPHGLREIDDGRQWRLDEQEAEDLNARPCTA